MPSPSSPAGVRYLIGAVSVLVAAAVHIAARVMWGFELGIAPFVAAVAVVAWLAGMGPALLAVTLVLIHAVFVPYAVEAAQIARGVIWLLGGMALSLLIGSRQRQAEADTLLIDANREPVFIVDADGRLTSMNAAARSLTSGESATGTDALLRQLVAAGAGFGAAQHEFVIEHPQQSARTFAVTLSSNRDRRVFVLHPIKAAASAESREAVPPHRLQALADGCEAQMFHVEPDFQVTWSNRAFRERHGLEGDTQHLVWDLFDAQTRAALWSPLQRGMAGRYDTLEWRTQDFRGNSIWTLGLISPDVDADGEVRGCFVVCVDAGLLHGEQLRRHRSEDQRRSVLENLPDLVWMAAADGSGQWFNRRWAEYTGVTVDAWTEAMPPADRDRAIAAWQTARTAGSPLCIESRMRRHDGELRWHLVRMQPLRDLTGDPDIWGWSGSCTDIDDRKQAEVALRNTQQRVASFLGKISHELRNPLAALSASIQVLRHPRAEPRMTSRALDALERQSVALARLVDDLLQATRLIDGRIELQRRSVELGRLAREVCEELSERAAASEIALTCDMSERALPVFADPQRIKQTLEHLAVHALGSCSAGDSIRIYAIDGEEGEAGLRIADSGRGLSRDELTTIFELGSTQVGGHDPADSGLGLGLSVARRIAQLHGGRLVATSAGPGQGSAFDLFLPLHDAAASEPARDAAVKAQPLRKTADAR